LNAKKSIENLSKYCKSKNITIILANYPELHDVEEYKFEDVNRKLELLTDMLKIPYINLLNAVKNQKSDTLWVTKADTHPNAKANKLFSESILISLRKISPKQFPTIK